MLKDKTLNIITKYGITEAKVDLRVAERMKIFESLQLILALYFKILSVALSGLVLIRNFFEETYICTLHFLHLETIPICKSRDDAAAMQFRNS